MLPSCGALLHRPVTVTAVLGSCHAGPHVSLGGAGSTVWHTGTNIQCLPGLSTHPTPTYTAQQASQPHWRLQQGSTAHARQIHDALVLMLPPVQHLHTHPHRPTTTGLLHCTAIQTCTPHHYSSRRHRSAPAVGQAAAMTRPVLLMMCAVLLCLPPAVQKDTLRGGRPTPASFASSSTTSLVSLT